jgi:phosphodiesterase/alkaline phosphatase D-like protein
MKIIFTSCTRYEAFNKQPNWNDIYDQNPDYLFLLGDNIYMDYGVKKISKESNGSPSRISISDFEKKMKKKYQNQLGVPEFKRLVDKMKEKNGFHAIWDDHDFAWNNVSGSLVVNEKKVISRNLFHNFTGNCSTNHPNVYYHIDTPQARVIFIDNRYDSEPPGNNSKLISDEQFVYIEEKLNHNLKYTILCGGLTLNKGHENWANYPKQLEKLCKLLEGKEKMVFLAGDIHKNAFVKPSQLEYSKHLTPPQLISSGMYVNYLGLGLPFDNKKNWAMLEIDNNKFEVSFYNRFGKQNRKSRKATRWFDNSDNF